MTAPDPSQFCPICGVQLVDTGCPACGLITDGWNYYSCKCPRCGEKMVIMHPGDAKCSAECYFDAERVIGLVYRGERGRPFVPDDVDDYLECESEENE